MSLDSKVTSIHYLDANNPNGSFQVITHSPGVEYKVEHHSNDFYIVTNEEAVNFKLIKRWHPHQNRRQTVIPHRDDVMLSDVSAFADYLAI